MEGIAALIMWVLANAVYVDMRRRGEGGFKRLCAFWLGWPGTFVGMLSVDEGSQPSIRQDDEGLRTLVDEIRRDRLVRGGPATAEIEAAEDGTELEATGPGTDSEATESRTAEIDTRPTAPPPSPE